MGQRGQARVRARHISICGQSCTADATCKGEIVERQVALLAQAPERIGDASSEFRRRGRPGHRPSGASPSCATRPPMSAGHRPDRARLSQGSTTTSNGHGLFSRACIARVYNAKELPLSSSVPPQVVAGRTEQGASAPPTHRPPYQVSLSPPTQVEATRPCARRFWPRRRSPSKEPGFLPAKNSYG